MATVNHHSSNSSKLSAESTEILNSVEHVIEATSEWNDHEHQADAAQLHAQQLLDAVGSPELAKVVLDRAVHSQDKIDCHRREAAEKLGFDSYQSLLVASTPVLSDDHRLWYVINIASGDWVIWNDDDHELNTYDSRENALRSVATHSAASDD